MTKIKVSGNGNLTVETKEWNTFWQPLNKLNNAEINSGMEALYAIWGDYVHSGFNSLLRKTYCFRYFSLLNILLSNCIKTTASSAWRYALQTALGFECFGIAPEASSFEVLCAGTSSIRNPCYLLAKLKMPDIPDNPQFLPLITVTKAEPPELFYHYRQYTLSSDSPVSILLYPSVSGKNRLMSFKLLNLLANSIKYGADPWTPERARQIYQGIIQSILQAIKTDRNSTLLIEFIDVGAASGSLVSMLCRHIQKMGISMGFKPMFQLWSIDLEPANPARFYGDAKLIDQVDNLTYLGDDYRNWLSRSHPLPASKGIRIALISKLLDVTSKFSIICVPLDKLLSNLPGISFSSNLKTSSPVVCLSPNGKGINKLIISNLLLTMLEGKAYPHVSLSEFYRAMRLISNEFNWNNEGEIFLALRKSNPECLITLDGKSIIQCLMENCDYLIIEDMDLIPPVLIAHMTAFSLQYIAIYDMTKALKLKSNHAYVIQSKTLDSVFSGEQIW